MKTLTSIYIEKEILEQAKELGLNISKTVEILLANYIKQIKQIQNSKLSNCPEPADKHHPNTKGMVGPPGFEPGIASAPGWYPRPN